MLTGFIKTNDPTLKPNKKQAIQTVSEANSKQTVHSCLIKIFKILQKSFLQLNF